MYKEGPEFFGAFFMIYDTFKAYLSFTYYR